MAILHTTVLVVARLQVAASFHILQTRQPSLLRYTPSSRDLIYTRSPTHAITTTSTTALHGLFDDETDASDNPSEIPPELRNEIYAAESNTPAAQGRSTRIIFYLLMTIAGVTTAFFNAFLTDLRFGDGAPSTELEFYGFGWIEANFLLNFAFTNKIGGAVGLLGAGLSGTLAEVEVRT